MDPLVIAHRGYSSRAPENTLAAFKLGWESGAEGVECDVHLTEDGEVVCIHDYDTGRVSTESLRIASSNWSDLRSLDVGSWKGDEWTGESIPLLKEAMQAGPSELIWVVEIKCGPEIVAPMLSAIDSTGHDWSRVIVISFDKEALRELKKQRPSIKAYWLSHLEELEGGLYSPSIEEIVEAVESLNVDGFGGQSGRGISAELNQALKEKNLELNIWTVDDSAEAIRMRSIGAMSITTNDPQVILDTLNRNQNSVNG